MSSSLEYSNKGDKFRFSLREWCGGPDRPEYTKLFELNVVGAMHLVEELEKFIKDAKSKATVNVLGKEMSLEDARNHMYDVKRKLNEFGEKL